MLSKAQVVKARKAFESMYDSKCSITEHQKYTKENTSVGYKDVPVLEDEPCHMSFTSSASAQEGEAVATVSQVIKLFISPDIAVKSGSKITIDKVDYTGSGVPDRYETHQEIILKLWERWV